MRLFDLSTPFTTIFGYALSYIEAVATLFGLLSIWLAARQNIWTWSTGLINIGLSFIIFYQVQLYADMFLQIYFLFTNMYGWLVWKKQFKENLRVTTLTTKSRVLIFTLILVSTCVFGLLIKNIHLLFPILFARPSAFPITDTFISVTSIIATILLAKRIIDNWILWLIVDITCAFVYAFKGIMFISLEYTIFCLLASVGMASWKKSIVTRIDEKESCFANFLG